MALNIPLLQPLRVKEFRLFWGAMAVSLVGDQLTFIALPWLVLKLTGDALAVGGVLAIASIPRAIFMLVGGVVTDRFSPRVVLIFSNAARMGLVLVIAALIFTDSIQMWQIYVVSLAFGIADAFMFPASISLPPRLLEDELLPAGNSLIQGTAGLSVIVGPALAGVIIAYVAAGEGSFVDQYGLATAFLLDGITFLAPVIAFLIIRDRFPPEAAPMGESLMHTMMEGLRYTWNDRPVRFLTFMIAGLSVVFRGPFSVGMPVFADQVLPQGAAGYGTIVATAGVGALLGVVVAGSLRRTPDSWLGSLILLDFGFYGLVFVGMTFTTDLVTICSMLFGASILDGYINIVLITWLQQRIPRERLGRVISVIMFFNLGLTPLSMAVAGWLIRWDLLTLMFSAGLVLWSVAVLGLLIRPLRQMGYEPD